MRVVVDTNVVVSAALKDRDPEAGAVRLDRLHRHAELVGDDLVRLAGEKVAAVWSSLASAWSSALWSA